MALPVDERGVIAPGEPDEGWCAEAVSYMLERFDLVPGPGDYPPCAAYLTIPSLGVPMVPSPECAASIALFTEEAARNQQAQKRKAEAKAA
jgi:hypothetical protein